eukprot:gene23129-biopygen7257
MGNCSALWVWGVRLPPTNSPELPLKLEGLWKLRQNATKHTRIHHCSQTNAFACCLHKEFLQGNIVVGYSFPNAMHAAGTTDAGNVFTSLRAKLNFPEGPSMTGIDPGPTRGARGSTWDRTRVNTGSRGLPESAENPAAATATVIGDGDGAGVGDGDCDGEGRIPIQW